VATWNELSSALFDALLAPFGHEAAWFDLLLWPVLAGVFALVVYKHVSNQKGIERAKGRIAAHLYEIRLFRHDPLAVIGSTGRIFLQNGAYVGHNLIPLAVLLVPMLAVLAQLEAHYAFDPSPVGSVQLLELRLDPKATVRPRDVALELPAGVALDAPPVRTADGEIYWRLRADAAGDHVLSLRLGGETLEKTWAVGGEPRKVPVKRTKSWEAFLYPGEPALSRGSAAELVALAYPERDLGVLPGGELGILALFFGLSLVAGFALKGPLGVTL
jgi:hypothetical protein